MQRVPSAGVRIATGPLKFEGDWCGYFYRGDELPDELLAYLRDLIDEPLIKERIDQEIARLRECIEPHA